MTDSFSTTDLAIQEVLAAPPGDAREPASHEAQLRQAQKMEAIGTLARGIAHDFNNILGAIVGNVELARQDLALDHPAHDNLERIMRSSARARDLVRQILTFSQKEEGILEAVQLRDLVAEGVALLHSSLPPSIEIEASLDPDCPMVLADAVQMRQLLMNLCTNAAQAIGAKNGRISIRLGPAGRREGRAELEGGSWVLLEVADDGPGMNSATLDRIFEPFFTTKAPGEGSGLGLSAVHGIVKAHGGTIFVSSRPGAGARFEVHLPAVARNPLRRQQSGLRHAHRGAGQKLLFVDDEAELTRVGLQMLERLGYRVVAANSGAQALEIFQAGPEPFDLLITDLTMPDMNGIALAQALLKLRPTLKVILVTGFSSDATRVEARGVGVTELVGKPYDLDTIAAAAHRALAKQERI